MESELIMLPDVCSKIQSIRVVFWNRPRKGIKQATWLTQIYLKNGCYKRVCVTLQSVEGDKYKHNTGIKSYQNHRWRTISEAVDSVLQYTVQIIT